MIELSKDEIVNMPLVESPLRADSMCGYRWRLIDNGMCPPHQFRVIFKGLFDDDCSMLVVWTTCWIASEVETAIWRVRCVLEEARGEIDALSLLKVVEMENAWLQEDIDIAMDDEDTGWPTRMAERAKALAPLLPRLAGAVGSPHLGAIVRANLAAWAAAQPVPAAPAPEGETSNPTADHPPQA